MNGSFRTRAAAAGLVIASLAVGDAAAAVLTANAPLVFGGRLASDDAIAFHKFELLTPHALDVAFESFSYAGGTLRNGDVVPAGGFDPVISLFDSDDRLIGFGDDGLRRRDPVSGDPYDAFLTMTLAPGRYQFAVTQYDNYPNASLGGFLSEGFSRSGEGNFTGGTCGASAFCDSGAFPRSPDYLVEVSALSSIPLPSAWLLLLGGLGAAGFIGARHRHA